MIQKRTVSAFRIPRKTSAVRGRGGPSFISGGEWDGAHRPDHKKMRRKNCSLKNEEGTGYVLKMWYPWPECSVSSIGDLGQAVNSLARLHVSMRRMPKHLLIKTGESAV